MSGPPPDPNALRRDRKDDASWTTLPATVKASPPPAWPLVGQSKREEVLWRSYWKKPQSLLWKLKSQEIEVALFIRRLAEVEEPEAAATRHSLVMKQMDSLLLTIPAMYRAHVKIAHDEVKARRTANEAADSGQSVRARLKVVGKNGGA
jgi:hypothetical protein